MMYKRQNIYVGGDSAIHHTRRNFPQVYGFSFRADFGQAHCANMLDSINHPPGETFGVAFEREILGIFKGIAKREMDLFLAGNGNKMCIHFQTLHLFTAKMYIQRHYFVRMCFGPVNSKIILRYVCEFYSFY